MNTNHLKKFAQESRRKLLDQVGAKLNFVLTTDSAELRERTEQLKQLRQELGRTTKEQLIEKVAYTWFNRLMALRFMDVNEYQPLGIRIITPKDGYSVPEILDEAKRGNIPDDLKVNRQKIFNLLDGKLSSSNPQNEAFKELLIASCNHLNTAFPFLFEKINDYTELLLPDDLTSDFSVVKDVRDGMLLEDCRNVEIIGWLYQFYISEKKDEVFASKSKVKKEDIPAATQLFTPRWIVEYMVQNTLGKLWLQNRPKSHLRKHMPYFIESESLEGDNYLKIQSPEEIKFLDPASGSGHILVYAFDLFTKIYEEEGYNITEIPQLIIERNLHGFEIDERASQLSALALMMKAREYNRRVFHKDIKPNIICYLDLQILKEEIKEIFDLGNIKISQGLFCDLLQMRYATHFGSLINPQADISEITHVTEGLTQFLPNTDVFQQNHVRSLIYSLRQISFLAMKFHCVVTNPPYLGSRKMYSTTSVWLKENSYTDVSRDLYSAFLKRCIGYSFQDGLISMITQISWMFTRDYMRFRDSFVKEYELLNALILGSGVFETISGEVVKSCAFLIRKRKSDLTSLFIDLVSYTNKAKMLSVAKRRYVYLKEFMKLKQKPFAFKLNSNAIKRFSQSSSLDDFLSVKQGLASSSNDRFIRYHWEISLSSFKANLQCYDNKSKWLPYDKGGGYKKFYGNEYFVINWLNNGEEIKKFPRSVIRNPEYYFRRGLTFNLTGKISLRLKNYGHIFDVQGSSIFIDEERFDFELIYFFLGLLNSNLTPFLTDLTNPTMVTQVGDLKVIPVVKEDEVNKIIELVKSCVEITKKDWDSKEVSWEFEKHELIKQAFDENLTLEDAVDSHKFFWQSKFFSLHQQEEILNRMLIDQYQLSDEISSQISLKDVHILQDEVDKIVLSGLNKKLIRSTANNEVENYNEIDLPINNSEIIIQYLSIAVGCFFGRFSLDKGGFILANQGETLEDYLLKIEKNKTDCTFMPDGDNIIPILDDAWFEDDIVSKFYKFLKVTFGEKNFNKNLAFIEEQIGKDIRKYFIKDFYPDHIKRYKRRPIYWMFSSPKGSFNVLIYMHRYTPNTVSNILNKYLKEFIGKLNTRKEHLQHVQATGSASDKSKAIKESDNIQKMLVELHEYERDILYPLATERIEIDLDDGVLVNYNKFGKAVKEVHGLNDPATKKKVKQFDWIDTSQIR